MFARPHAHWELEELVKWTILVVLAAALTLFAVSPARGWDRGARTFDSPMVTTLDGPGLMLGSQ